MITTQLLIPLLISVSSTITGWNALYVCSGSVDMESRSFAALEVKAKEKCGNLEVVYEDGPHFSHVCQGPRYVDHSFAYISCRRTP